MNQLILKYFDRKQIDELVKEKELSEDAYAELLRFLTYHLEQVEKYGTDEENQNGLLSDSVEYMDEIKKLQELGYGFTWAQEFALTKLWEPYHCYSAIAYTKALKVDPVQAKKDLELYAKETGKDEHFIRHFDFLIHSDSPSSTSSVEHQATSYSEIYKHELIKGNSAIFADRFADCMAMNQYTSLSCFAEAKEYEFELSNGSTKSFASAYAMKMAEYIANYCSSFEESLQDELANAERNMLREKYKHLNNR